MNTNAALAIIWFSVAMVISVAMFVSGSLAPMWALIIPFAYSTSVEKG